MKKNLLIGLVLSGVIITGVVASSHTKTEYKDYRDGSKHYSKKMMKRSYKNSDFMLMKVFKKLNLSDEQKEQVMQIKQEIRKKAITPDIAFTKNSFDKTKFIEIMKQKRDNMIESKAEMIDKVYNILTDKQKEQLKVLIDLKKEKMLTMIERRMSFDSHSHGRR
ncbi:MAG: hypothetical protein GY932_04125 [Arcobacter sp.]|nr:hypothetical protein [Arcobacter sp.]